MLLKDSRQHYDILDGLRGVAALIVIVYHVFEISPERLYLMATSRWISSSSFQALSSVMPMTADGIR